MSPFSFPLALKNPLKELATNFLAEVLAQKSRAVVPVTSVIAAYQIATRYLGTKEPIEEHKAKEKL